jgi:hypothetical protein
MHRARIVKVDRSSHTTQSRTARRPAHRILRILLPRPIQRAKPEREKKLAPAPDADALQRASAKLYQSTIAASGSSRGFTRRGRGRDTDAPVVSARPSRIKPEFAEWMRSHLGYYGSEMNVPLGDDVGTPGSVVGIRGETYGAAWHRLRSVALIAFAAAVVLRNVEPASDGEVPVVPNVLFCFAAVVYLVARIGRARTREYSWVECKDLNRPVSRKDIVTLAEAVKKVGASEAARWKPARVLIVAGDNGFENDALTFARAVGVECHRRTKSGFERAT